MRLPIAEVRKNLRNINIIAHSHGACVVSIFGDMLNKKMIELGYNQKDADMALREIFVITAGSTVLMGVSKFKTLNFVSRSDLKVIEGFIPKSLNRVLCRRIPRPSSICQLYAVSENENVLAVDKLCAQTIEPNDTVEHKFKNYLTSGEDEKTPEAQMATQIALNIFQTSIFNSIYNQRQSVFVPLEATLKNIKNSVLLKAKKAGKDELTALAGVKNQLKQAVHCHMKSVHRAMVQLRSKTM